MNELSVHERLMRGEVVRAGSRLYARCATCLNIVRINKPIVGDWHFCLTDEEIAAQRSKSA
jgi:hypothetical protein